MKNQSKTLVNNKQEFSFSQDTIDDASISRYGENNLHLLFDNESTNAKLIASDFSSRNYSVRINSNVYEVKILSSLDDLIKKMGYDSGSSKAANSIIAPMPGVIISLEATMGQLLKKGDPVVILEAMKMENTILSPREGIVKDIYISVGDTVDKNKLLIDFE